MVDFRILKKRSLRTHKRRHPTTKRSKDECVFSVQNQEQRMVALFDSSVQAQKDLCTVPSKKRTFLTAYRSKRIEQKQLSHINMVASVDLRFNADQCDSIAKRRVDQPKSSETEVKESTRC